MNDIEKRTLTIERVFNAPLTLVWEAWTQEEHIPHWWAPRGMDFSIEAHNFNVGGQWKYAMTMPDGNAFISEGVFAEIIEFEKIITSADFKPMTEGVEMHILFEATETGTKLTLQVIHPTEEYCKLQEQMGFMNGWGSVFDRLGQHLTTS